MATTTITTAATTYLEPIDELILKFIGGDDDALSALLKHKDALSIIAAYKDLDHSEILACFLWYDHKFHSLPRMNDLSDYIEGMSQNAGLLIEMDEIVELAGEEFDPVFSSFDVLIDHVAEQVAAMRFEDKINIARKIAIGGRWADPDLPPSKKKLWKGAAAATEWLNSQVEAPALAGYLPEEGEVQLVGELACRYG